MPWAFVTYVLPLFWNDHSQNSCRTASLRLKFIPREWTGARRTDDDWRFCRARPRKCLFSRQRSYCTLYVALGNRNGHLNNLIFTFDNRCCYCCCSPPSTFVLDSRLYSVTSLVLSLSVSLLLHSTLAIHYQYNSTLSKQHPQEVLP